MRVAYFLLALCLNFTTHSEVFAKKPKGAKKKLTGTGDQTELDFEGDNITGKRKVPLSSLVKESRIVESQALVKIRYHWRPEIAASGNIAEIGKGRKKRRRRK